jgi:hypothetical protein
MTHGCASLHDLCLDNACAEARPLAPTLLAIDDEPVVLTIVEWFARDLGFHVVTSADSRMTLTNLHVLKPDAVMVRFTHARRQWPGRIARHSR